MEDGITYSQQSIWPILDSEPNWSIIITIQNTILVDDHVIHTNMMEFLDHASSISSDQCTYCNSYHDENIFARFICSINCEANTRGSLLSLKKMNGKSSMSDQERVSRIYNSFCISTNPCDNVQLRKFLLRKTEDYYIYLETRHEKCVA